MSGLEKSLSIAMFLTKLIVPRPARRRLSNFYLDRFRDNFARAHTEVPRYELEARHIRNLVVLTDRVELLKRLPHGGIVAEVGVDHGDFSSLILEHNQPRKLHLIDAWSSERYHQGLRDLVAKKFASEIAEGHIEINEAYQRT